MRRRTSGFASRGKNEGREGEMKSRRSEGNWELEKKRGVIVSEKMNERMWMMSTDEIKKRKSDSADEMIAMLSRE